MISQKYRFHGYRSLQFVLKRGQTFKSEYFSLKHIKSKKSDYRLSIIVSKKIDKKAVVRNRIRRRLYELFRQAFKDLPLQADIAVIVLKVDLASMSYKELEKIFNPALLVLKTQYKS